MWACTSLWKPWQVSATSEAASSTAAGGIAVWFFLASLLGISNKLTLVGLYDIKALETVGTGDVNTDFVWKLIVLAVVAFVPHP